MADAAHIGELQLETDISPASWIEAGVRPRRFEVGSLVPDGFAAYARVFHPAYRRGEGREVEVPWSSVAASNDRVSHPAMEWIAITGSWRYLHRDSQAGLWDRAPEIGSLPPRQLARVATTLSQHTVAPEVCWFAVWEGYGALAVAVDDIPKFVHAAPGPMAMFSGPLSAAMTSFIEPIGHQSANMWWPEDHAWLVATNVDLMTTYVAASGACIDALVTDQDLEAMRVSVNQGVTSAADTLNPAPAGSPVT